MRYTFDDWGTILDVQARPCTGGDESSRRFVACIPCPSSGEVCLQFVIRHRTASSTSWDNNYGRRYAMPVGDVLRQTSAEPLFSGRSLRIAAVSNSNA